MLNRFLDSLPPFPTVLFGGVLSMAPIFPEPHLVQKFHMAMNGVPFAPIDVFDVVMHGSAGVLVVLMLYRQWQLKKQGRTDADTSSKE